jgi:hypothetical protein
MNIGERAHAPIKKGWSIFLAVIFTLTLVPTIIILPVNHTVFNPQFYISTIEKEKLIDQIPHLVASTLQSVSSKHASESASSDSGATNLFKNLNEEQVNMLISSLIPQGWIDNQINAATTSILDFLNLKSPRLQIRVDLIPIKMNLEGETGKNAVYNIMSVFPECTVEQIIQVAKKSIDSGNLLFPMCRPPINNPKVLNPVIELLLPQISKSIPPEIIYPSGSQTLLVQKLIDSPIFKIYKILKLSMFYIPIASLVFGLLVLIASLGSARLLFSAIGVPLLISGLIAGLVGLLVIFGGQQLLPLAFKQLGQMSDLQLAISGIVKLLASGVAKSILIASGLALASGIVLIIVSRIMKK